MEREFGWYRVKIDGCWECAEWMDEGIGWNLCPIAIQLLEKVDERRIIMEDEE